jgi:hypothetical protein
MSTTTILINISEGDFESLLKKCIREVLKEMNVSNQEEWPEVLDAEQAAKFLKLEINTLYEKTCKRLVPFYKKGKKLYFYLSELKDYLTSGRIKTAKEIEGEAVTRNLNKR